MADRYTPRQIEDAISSLRSQGRAGKGTPKNLRDAIMGTINADARRRRGERPEVSTLDPRPGLTATPLPSYTNMLGLGPSGIATLLEGGFAGDPDMRNWAGRRFSSGPAKLVESSQAEDDIDKPDIQYDYSWLSGDSAFPDETLSDMQLTGREVGLGDIRDPTLIPKSDASMALTGRNQPFDNPETTQDPRTFGPSAGPLEGQPLGEMGFMMDYPARPDAPLLSRATNASTVPYELQRPLLAGDLDPNAAAAGIIPGPTSSPYEGDGGLMDWLRRRNEQGLMQETGMRIGMVPNLQPSGDSPSEGGGRFGGAGLGSKDVPAPAPPAAKPEADTALTTGPLTPKTVEELLSGGVSGEAATGALSLPDFLKHMENYYPDLDFSNPKQAEAEANARRNLDRTALLAQLQVAGGMLMGAGKSWEGLGKGFLGAAEQYDKGYEKYQNALQDSADRYADQSKVRQAYELQKRGAALDLFMDFEKERRADRRAVFGSRGGKDRSFDMWKFTEEQKRANRNDFVKSINDRYAPYIKVIQDDEMMEPEEKRKKLEEISQLIDESTRAFEVVNPGNFYSDTADE